MPRTGFDKPQREWTGNRKFDEGPIETEPLLRWRHLPADALGSCEAAEIRRALRGVSILRERGWPDAIRGVAAEAIGVAIRVAVKRRSVAPIEDVVMSAVAAAAIGGDAAARAFMVHIFAKRSAFQPAAPRLAKSWTAANGDSARAALRGARTRRRWSSNRLVAQHHPAPWR